MCKRRRRPTDRPGAVGPGGPWVAHATLRPGAITSEAGLQADTEDSLRFGPPWPFGLN